MSFTWKNQECFSFLGKTIFLFKKILFNGCGTPCICIPGLLQREAYAGLCASHVANTVVCGAVCSLPASRYTTPGTQPKISFVPIVRRIFMVTLTGLCFRENFWISPALSVLLYLFSCYLTPFFSPLVSSLSRTCFPQAPSRHHVSGQFFVSPCIVCS